MKTVAVLGCLLIACSSQRTADLAGDAGDAPRSAIHAVTASTPLGSARVRWTFGGIDNRIAYIPASDLSLRRTADGFAAADTGPSALGARVRLPLTADGALEVAARGAVARVRLVGALPAQGALGDGGVAYEGAIKDATLFRVASSMGATELIELRARPAERVVRWELETRGVAGLRLVSNVLELLDEKGDPKIHTIAPTIVDATGVLRSTAFTVEGCAVDRDVRAPWSRPVVAPGSARCTVVARFDDEGLSYPLLVDPPWTSAGNLANARAFHQATAVKTPSGACTAGCVVVTGGRAANSSTILAPPVGATEMYNESTASWAAMASMTIPVWGHAAVPWYVRSGTVTYSAQVLVAGGARRVPPDSRPDDNNDTTAAAYIFDPTAGTWTSVGPIGLGDRMGLAGASFTGSWNDGVSSGVFGIAVFAGGADKIYDTRGSLPNFVEETNIYRTSSIVGGGTWSTSTGFEEPDGSRGRSGHVMAGFATSGCLPGTVCSERFTVYLAGGVNERGARANTFQASHTYSSSFKFTWTAGPPMSAPRFDAALAVNNGVAYVAGGYSVWGSPSAAVDGFDLRTSGAVSGLRPLNTARAQLAGAPVLLGSGAHPLFVGGATTLTATTDSADVVMPTITAVATPMLGSRYRHTATALQNGKVLVVGGRTPSSYLSTTELFAPQANGVSCTVNADCATNSCVDGVCCDTACTGTCEACNLPSARGTCTTVNKTNGPTGYPPGQAVTGYGTTTRTLCAPFGEPCGFACHGTDATTCTVPATAPTCAPGSCTGGIATDEKKCDPTGYCPAATYDNCAPYACGPTACRTACSDSAHCATGFKCTGSICQPTGERGSACTTTTECSTGLGCVDGVCCGTTTCPAGQMCNTPAARGTCKLPNGAACTSTTAPECSSGNCVDGVCCDKGCGAQCEACDVAGSVGTCTAVVGRPHGGRGACIGSGPCQAQCDGSNRAVCASVPGPTFVCEAARCACAGTPASCEETATRFCNGLGACAAATPRTCREYKCGSSACLGSCSTTADCTSGHTCIGGSCVTTGANGTSCKTGDQCTSTHCVDGVCCEVATCTAPTMCSPGSGKCGKPRGVACSSGTECGSGFFCVDGFCCNSLCAGQCQACDVSGAEGTCSAAAGKPHGARTACAGTAPCQASCNGSNQLACDSPPGTSTTCSPPQCVSGIAEPPSFCDGAGNCRKSPSKPCRPYVCDATDCKTVCTTAADCLTGYTCKENACVPKGGTACTSRDDCVSGFCIDGVCCNTACAGQCEACDVPGAEGMCSPVAGAPHGARMKCFDGGGDVCKALSCDGSDRTTCAKSASPGIKCGEATCKDGTFSDQGSCDGKGGCSRSPPASCLPFLCADATKCATSCASSADCVKGFLCGEGKCRAITSECTPDGNQSLPLDGSSPKACAPFKCDPSTGNCYEKCGATEQCTAGAVCDGAKCVQQPAAAAEDDGGCSFGPPRSRAHGSLIAALVGVGLLRRRRRGASRSTET